MCQQCAKLDIGTDAEIEFGACGLCPNRAGASLRVQVQRNDFNHLRLRHAGGEARKWLRALHDIQRGAIQRR